jgi:hypothetical protein
MVISILHLYCSRRQAQEGWDAEVVNKHQFLHPERKATQTLQPKARTPGRLATPRPLLVLCLCQAGDQEDGPQAAESSGLAGSSLENHSFWAT